LAFEAIENHPILEALSEAGKAKPAKTRLF
jgi:hypothetical protein